MLKDVLTGLCDLVYPPHCTICHKYLDQFPSDDALCLRCYQNLPRNSPPFCPKCSRHLISANNPQCRECSKANLQFDFAWAACLYNDPLRAMIAQFKYNQKTYLCKPFGRFLIEFIEIYRLDIAQFDIIVPVPLFPSRLRERGYNQSRLIAEEIAHHYRIKLSYKNLVRWRYTQHQTQLNEKERWTNIQGAFRIRNFSEFHGKNILIIDDLLTTGATSSEVAKALKNTGAQTVGVLTLAITV